MGYIILLAWITLLPLCAGGIFCTKKNIISLPAQWLWGQFALWGAFQLSAVPFIIKELPLERLIPIYMGISFFAALTGFACRCIVTWRVDKVPFRCTFAWIKDYKFLAGIVAVLCLVQAVMFVVLAVNDGDDAYYMAVANQAESSGLMYTANVYAFGGSGLNYRYALAPLPIWIAFLSSISGVHTLVIGHIIMGIMSLIMSYLIYAGIGQELFGSNYKKRLQMLVLTSILFMWSNTSSHTPESFLLLRSRQGKALVSGLVFPAMVYLLIKIGHALEQHRKIQCQDYLMAAVVILAGCLGSTLGGALVIMLWASGIFFLAVGYKKPILFIPGIISVLPGMIYVLLYLLK